MATFKNITDHQIDVPLYDLHVAPGDTFEVPDEVAYSFDGNPDFATSKTKSPDTVVDPAVVESSIPFDQAVAPQSPAVAPAAPASDAPSA